MIAVNPRGALGLFLAHLSRWLPAAERATAVSAIPSIVVRIAGNERGGFSIYAVSDEARTLFGGDGPCGNFGTYADAFTRAQRDNCWTVEGEKEAA